MGAAAVRPWQADELFALIRRADPYTALTREQFDAVLEMVAGEHPFEMARPPVRLVLWDKAADRISPTRGAANGIDEGD